jgi:SAM-dependent methyltransferase
VSQHFITRAVVSAARRLPNYPDLDAADLACGRGEIAAALAGDGVRIRGSRFRADDYELSAQKPRFENFPIDEAVDLEKTLPYESASFDLIILAEVIEHLERHQLLIEEIGRILRRGGSLILTTPNLGRLHSRLHFLLTGTHKLIRRRVGWDVPPAEWYAYHNHPADFPLLHSMLFHAGMRVRDLRFTRMKWEHAWTALLVPLVAMATARETSRRLTGPLHSEGERDLRHWMMHPALLFSEQLLLIAERP